MLMQEPPRAMAPEESESSFDTPTLPHPRRAVKRKKPLGLIVRVVLSGGMLALLLAKIDTHSFLNVLTHADLALVGAGLGIGLLTIVLSAWQWQIVLRHEGITIGLPVATGLYFLGMTFNQLLPSSIGGDVAKASYIARWTGRGVEAASATLMARVIGVFALLLTALPVAVAASIIVSRLGWELTLVLLAVAGAYGVLMLGLLFAGGALRSWARTRRFLQRGPGGKVVALAESVGHYRSSPRVWLSTVGVSVIFYFASNLNFYCYGLALHLRSPFWFYWIAIPLTSIITMLPISLNGYGVRGASFVAVFALMGEAPSAALSLALAMEIQMVIFALAGGLVILGFHKRHASSAYLAQSTTFHEQEVRSTHAY